MSKHSDAFLTDFQKQVCLGTLLGDSSLNKPKNGRNYHLSCYHSEKQLDWLKKKWAWLQPHTSPIQNCAYKDKRNGKTYRGGRFHTISAPCFTELAPLFYVEGRKIISSRLKHDIKHPIALACLICDDGSWDRAGISIASKQFTVEENEVLAATLADIFGLSISVMARNNDYPYIRITAISVEKTFQLCQAYVPKTMYYKFGGIDYRTRLTGKITKICPTCNNPFESYKSANQTYCDRKCADVGKPKGYATRAKMDVCPLCRKEFLRYSKRQKTCVPCRDKPFSPITCGVCGKSLAKRNQKYCAGRCAVIACHKAQGHIIRAIPKSDRKAAAPPASTRSSV